MDLKSLIPHLPSKQNLVLLIVCLVIEGLGFIICMLLMNLSSAGATNGFCEEATWP